MRPALALVVLVIGCTPDTKVGYYNTPPSVSIVSPPDGSEVEEGVTVTFEAIVSDDFDDPSELEVIWSSNVDGTFEGDMTPDGDGYALFSTANLSSGNHTIAVRVVDTDGESARDEISLVVTSVTDAPTMQLVHPASGESGVEDEDFEFVAKVGDDQDAAEDLLVVFTSDVTGDFCTPTPDAVGVATCELDLPAGDHFLTFTVTDLDGNSDAETTYFAVTSLEDVDNDGDGFTEAQGDCDDGDASVGPTADEYYNGRDDDCDGVVDNDTEGYDDDGDGVSEVGGDCDDDDADTYPGAEEVYDATDNDCDGIKDEGTEGYDDDGDGYTEIGGDCDDSDAASHYGATEIADGADNDCDGTIDEGPSSYDDDGDGYTEDDGDCDDTDSDVSPAATEVCGDGADNDCDGSADEAGASGCTTYYYDYDGDGYGASGTGTCLCSTSGYYTSRYDTDCYDYNSAANPAATTYYSVSRGDGSYDYNCDSTTEKYYKDTYECYDFWAIPPCDFRMAGWESSAASCGSSGNYITGCSVDWFDCDVSRTTKTQSCL